MANLSDTIILICQNNIQLAFVQISILPDSQPLVLFSIRLMCGLRERLSSGVSGSAPSSVHFYELRLMFLITALRRELSTQLQQVT